MYSLRFRLHEWLADRVPSIQYPKPQLMRRRPPLFQWKHAMPWEQRLLIAVLSLIALGVLIPTLCIMIYLVWLFISSI